MSRAYGLFALLLAGSIALALPLSTSRAANRGAPILPQPCAACHLPSAEGVPGAFPPLKGNFRALAASPAGRRYIVLVVSHGLAGPLVIDGKMFNGVMPAQSLRDEDIVQILNGLLGPGQRTFTTREVASLRASGTGLAGTQVARLRPALKAR